MQAAYGAMVNSGIFVAFLGALQASLAVLLTISYGVLASRLHLLKASSARDISKTCVRLFLPALLITSVGSELHADTTSRYVPVLLWALTYTLLSMGLGWSLKRLFKFPAWTVPAICFNNTTALPLLLIQSLESAGILSDFVKDENDSTSAAVSRAKSYFLVSAMVGNSLTFAMGPKLLDDEESPDHKENKPLANGQNGQTDDEESTLASEEEYDENRTGRTAEEEENDDTERTTLLPTSIDQFPVIGVYEEASTQGERLWGILPPFIRRSLASAGEYVNAPLIGALIGVVLGLTPWLHRAFFNHPKEGGIFKAWLTTSIENIGGLFPSLQLMVVGSKLSNSITRAKNGEDSGHVPWVPMLTIFFIRFLLWPAISIGVIFLLASRTNFLDDDPILWFVLMLLPTGPSATKLTALADVSGASEEQKMSLSKFLTFSYAVSPVICIAVVGSLKASLAVPSYDGGSLSSYHAATYVSTL